MYLRDIAGAFPEKVVDTDTVASWTGAKADFIRKKIGVDKRYFLGDGERGLDLAATACDLLYKNNPELAPEKTGAILYVTQNPDFKIPNMSGLLQDKMGILTDAACFDLNLGCSGYVYGLSVLRAFMKEEEIPDALLITCDPYSKIMSKSDTDTVTVFGDAATATWISDKKGAGIGKGNYGTDGGGAENLIVRGGAAASSQRGVWADDEASWNDKDANLKMNGRAIFNFMMKRIPDSVRRCLKKNKLNQDDIDYFVFHQASSILVRTLADHMELDENRVPFDISNTGNTISSSIPLVLSRLFNEGKLDNAKVLVSGFGVGLSWATNVLSFGERA